MNTDINADIDTDIDIAELIGKIGSRYSNNMELPDPDKIMYYYNLKKRILWINKDINENLFIEIRQILKWNQEDKEKTIEDREPIRIFIQSYGGDLSPCFAFIDVVSLSKTPVYTYNMGACMSAALLMLLSGHKRYCLKNSQAMIHQGSGQVGGDYVNIEAAMESYKKMIVVAKDYILQHTLIDTKTYNKYKEKDWYLFADDQVKYGIVEEIIQDLDKIL